MRRARCVSIWVRCADRCWRLAVRSTPLPEGRGPSRAPQEEEWQAPPTQHHCPHSGLSWWLLAVRMLTFARRCWRKSWRPVANFADDPDDADRIGWRCHRAPRPLPPWECCPRRAIRGDRCLFSQRRRRTSHADGPPSPGRQSWGCWQLSFSSKYRPLVRRSRRIQRSKPIRFRPSVATPSKRGARHCRPRCGPFGTNEPGGCCYLRRWRRTPI